MDSFRGLTRSESMLWYHAEMTTVHTVQVDEHYRPLQQPLHELKLSFEPGLSILNFVWKLQASTAGLQDLVIMSNKLWHVLP